jgi:hypothetical protein
LNDRFSPEIFFAHLKKISKILGKIQLREILEKPNLAQFVYKLTGTNFAFTLSDCKMTFNIKKL